jgi:hypothetical protein
MQFQTSVLSAASSVLAVALAGCTTYPAEDAIFGKPQRLMDMALSGQLNPNVRLRASNIPGDSQNTITPLCALAQSMISAPAVDALLRQGADVNMPCRASETQLPLDLVMSQAHYRGSVTLDNRPTHVPTFLAYAEKFVSRGGRSEKGALSFDQVKMRLASEIARSNSLHPEVVSNFSKSPSQATAYLARMAEGVTYAAPPAPPAPPAPAPSVAAQRPAPTAPRAPTSDLPSSGAGQRAHAVIMLAVGGVDTPRKVTTRLNAADKGAVSICGRKFLMAGVAEDGVRSFTCDGSGVMGGGTYIDGQRTGELQWGYSIDTDGQSLKIKSYQAWGENYFPDAQEPATLIYYRFTSGPLAGRSYGTIVGKVPGRDMLYLSSNYFTR